MTRNYGLTSSGQMNRCGGRTEVIEIRPLRPNQAVILPGVGVKGKGVKLEVKSRCNYRSRTGFSQNDGIAQFSGSFAKRSYQRSLSYNELSFVDKNDYFNENFYQNVETSNYFSNSNKKLDVKNFHGNRSRTPTSPNPYSGYYSQIYEDFDKTGRKPDPYSGLYGGRDFSDDDIDQRHRTSSSPASIIGRRASPSLHVGTPNSSCARTPITPSRNSPSFTSPVPPLTRPKTVGHGLGSNTSFPLRLSQRSSSLLSLPTAGRNHFNEDLARNHFSDKVSKDRCESGNPGRSRSSTPPRAFTSHHALCTNQGYNCATSSQGVHGTYEFLFNRHLRALTNLDAGSFECLDKYGQGDPKEVPEETDNESLTESEELSIIGEDLVSSSLAEVTEILDRHIDPEDKTGTMSKRKRISFNVPAIAFSPSEEVDDEEEDFSQQQKSESG